MNEKTATEADDDGHLPTVEAIEVFSLTESPLVGLMFIQVAGELESFVINEEAAEALAKRLERFLRGEAQPWAEADKTARD